MYLKRLKVRLQGVYVYKNSPTNFKEISRRYPGYIFKEFQPEDFYVTSHTIS